MTRIRIEAIGQEYHDEAPYYMLLAWFKRAARSTDKAVILIHALVTINRWDLARTLQSIKEEKHQEPKSISKDGNKIVFNKSSKK